MVRAPLVFVRYRACFLLEGERYWEIFLGFARPCTKPPPPCMEPHGIPVVPTCLFPTFVGTGLSWFYFVWMMDVIGRRWSLMSWIFQCWSTGTNCARVSGRGFLLQDSPQALRWTISIPYHQQHVFFWLGVHKLECMGKLECMDEWFGLPRSRHLSLRRSGHDAGFVGGRDRSYNPLLLWI